MSPVTPHGGHDASPSYRPTDEWSGEFEYSHGLPEATDQDPDSIHACTWVDPTRGDGATGYRPRGVCSCCGKERSLQVLHPATCCSCRERQLAPGLVKAQHGGARRRRAA